MSEQAATLAAGAAPSAKRPIDAVSQPIALPQPSVAAQEGDANGKRMKLETQMNYAQAFPIQQQQFLQQQVASASAAMAAQGAEGTTFASAHNLPAMAGMPLEFLRKVDSTHAHFCFPP